MNTPATSKINWTALVMALVGLATIYDVIPAEAEDHVISVTLILGPALVATFRTWFTGPPK